MLTCTSCGRREPELTCGYCDDCADALTAQCKGCGHREPEDILECGYCPGCADECLCSGCRCPCDPSFGLCDDCADAQRDALDEEGEP
jgi:hypothetical protein